MEDDAAATRRPDHRRELEIEADKRRAIMRAVMAHFDLSQKGWCDRAGLRNASSLGNFLSGKNPKSPKTLNINTLTPLANAVDLKVGHLLGEIPLPWDEAPNAPTPASSPVAADEPEVEIAITGADFQFKRKIPADRSRISRLIRDIMTSSDDQQPG